MVVVVISVLGGRGALGCLLLKPLSTSEAVKAYVKARLAVKGSVAVLGKQVLIVLAAAHTQ